MHSSFFWTSEYKDFLFYGYNITSPAGLSSTCFGLLALSVLFEWLKLIQARHRQNELFLRAKQIRRICPPSESSTLLFDNVHTVEPKNITLCDRALLFIWDAFLWLNLQILGYLLMLAAMGFSGWMVVSLVIGSAIGYFIFGPSFMKINLQNCQAIRDTFCALNCGEPEIDGETTPVLRGSADIAIPHSSSQVAACVHAPQYVAT